MAETKLKKPKKKMEPYTPQWERLANQVAREYVIIHSCRDCGRPTIQGYCCTFCGSGRP